MRMVHGIVRLFTLVALTAAFAPQASAAPIFFEPTPYLSAADSPFDGGSFSYFYLETFEDGLLNTPGVTASGGTVIGWDQYVDSVDADVGGIDGSGGPNGHSWYSNFTEDSFTFTFDPLVLGALPTHAGIVWTDIGFNAPTPYYGPVSFEAFDGLGLSLGVIGPYLLGDGMDTGQTAEDRFFGIFNAGGISAIRISTNNTDWEVDHLQYGLASRQSVPEPSALALIGIGTVGLLRSRLLQRRRARSEQR